MSVFLTGATGFIGSFVAQQLVERGHQVTCLVRKTSDLRWIEALPLNFHVGSLTDPASYENALKECEYVIHVAGVTKAFHESGFYRGNVESTEALLKTIETLNLPVKRFLLVSSQAAVGPSPSVQPITEDQPCHPLTIYGKSKYQSEIIAREYQNRIPVTIIRPPVVYGPRDKDVLNLFKSIQMGLNVMVGKTDQYVSLVYVEDLARGIMDATFSEKTAGNTYFVCEETAYYWSQVAHLIGELLDRKFVTIKLPIPVARTIAFFMEMSGRLTGQSTILNREKMLEIKEPFWVISPQKAQEDFQYSTQYPLKEGIQNTIEWYREHQWLSK